MLTARWTALGPPLTPRVSFLRGVGWVRITQEDIDEYGETGLRDDTEMLLERVIDDPEARFRIAGPAPKKTWAEEEQADYEARHSSSSPAAKPRRGGKRGWLATLLGR
ncbi:MAG: hypothetical protein R6V07_07330 [Armatimonadota bacterium]